MMLGAITGLRSGWPTVWLADTAVAATYSLTLTYFAHAAASCRWRVTDAAHRAGGLQQAEQGLPLAPF